MDDRMGLSNRKKLANENYHEPNKDLTKYKDLAWSLEQQAAQHPRLCGLTLDSVGAVLGQLMALMFPHFANCKLTRRPAEIRLTEIDRELNSIISCLKDSERVPRIVEDYLLQLPSIAEECLLDAQALADGDPAAETLEEVILSYPGFYAVAVYRLANPLLHADIPILPRLMTEFAHQRTGIDIHPGAKIGSSFYIDHGTSVVIGETCVIGDHVKLYQGVTLGGLRVEKGSQSNKRHPTLEDGVTVYANATILGGETIVGQGSLIGGNVWLTRSVPARSRVMFKPSHTEDMITYADEMDGSGI